MVTLYITDLDGTLLDNDACVAPATSRLISELSSEGALISVATARTPATVEPILANTLTADELVVMTGAAIWDRRAGRFAEIKLLREAEVPRMLEVFERHRLSPFCYTLSSDDRRLEVFHPSPRLSATEQIFVDQRRNLELKTFRLGEVCRHELYGRVALFFGMGRKEAIVAVAEELTSVTDSYISYYKDTYNDDLWLLEIFGPGVSKAEGVMHLKQRLGADRVVAFGDNLNDIPMLRAADLGVAVGNALDEVKTAADCVIGLNTQGAVAKFIADDFRR